MIEDAYNFRGTMDYYVASENLQWSYLNGYTNQVNSATPGKTPMQYAKDIVSSYITDSGVSSAPYTYSVADMSKIDGLFTAINNLADVLNTTMAENISGFSQVIYNVQRFNNIDPLHTGIDTNDTYADLYDFAYQVESLYQTPSVTAAAQTLINAIQTYINYSAQNNNSDVKNSHGVSIFMPNTLSSFYTVDNYDFAWGTKWPIPGSALSVITNGSGWGNMLVTYFSITQPNGIDDPNPPEAFSKPQYYKYLFLPIVNN